MWQISCFHIFHMLLKFCFFFCLYTFKQYIIRIYSYWSIVITVKSLFAAFLKQGLYYFYFSHNICNVFLYCSTGSDHFCWGQFPNLFSHHTTTFQYFPLLKSFLIPTRVFICLCETKSNIIFLKYIVLQYNERYNCSIIRS